MTLVSTIGFSYTHHLVALSRNRIGYHKDYMAVAGEHISLSFGNNTAPLPWPSGGCLFV